MRAGLRLRGCARSGYTTQAKGSSQVCLSGFVRNDDRDVLAHRLERDSVPDRLVIVTAGSRTS